MIKEKALAKAIEELELTSSANDQGVVAQLFALSPVIDVSLTIPW